jgi:hypothetical protein
MSRGLLIGYGKATPGHVLPVAEARKKITRNARAVSAQRLTSSDTHHCSSRTGNDGARVFIRNGFIRGMPDCCG